MEEDLPLHDPARRGHNPQDGLGSDALPTPALAHHPQRVPTPYLKVRPIHRPDRAFTQKEVGTKVLDFQEQLIFIH